MLDCPPKESLERLLAETLNPEEQIRVELHVEHCVQCQTILDKLTRSRAGRSQALPRSIDESGKETTANPATEAFFDQLKKTAPTGSSGKPDRSFETPSGQPWPAKIEGYDILNELGRGAVGVVYRARHKKLNRLVALKVIVAGPHLSAEVRQRFQFEAQAIARLKHPNIVQVYDFGEHEGFPYLSLELVDGENLGDWMAGKPRPALEAARVIATMAKAVEYGHRNGVVHRDLKPGNVLLSNVPDKPGRHELKITDFGIAKVLPGAGLADARMTQTGEILGTPAYMAPEQARGNPAEISPATDVYSMGAILYEMLTGRPPFQGATSLDTLLQAARLDPVPISLLVPRVPRDLETICFKCLEKDANKRYPTAAELAEDVGRFLSNDPIQARPISFVGLSVRWVRRHRGASAALAGVALLLVVLTIASLGASAYFRKLEQQQRELAQATETARGQAVLAEQRESKLRLQAESEGRELRQNLYFTQMNLAGQAAMSPSGIGLVCERLLPWDNSKPDLRNWEWYYLNSLCHREQFTLSTHTKGVWCVAWSPDGKKVASSGAEGVVAIWDAENGKELRHLTGSPNDVTSLAWSPDGARVATVGWDHLLRVWDVEKGAPLLTVEASTGDLFSVAWSPDGARLAVGDNQGIIRIWNADTGVKLQELRGHQDVVFGVSWSPDGARLASAGQDRTVRLWNPTTGEAQATLNGHVNWVKEVVWNKDGTRLASASNDHTIKIWDPNSNTEVKTIRGHLQAALSVKWSPDGTQLASCGEDQTLRVWQVEDARELYSLRGHTGSLTSVSWNTDGTRLASGSVDSTVKIWETSAGPELPTLAGHPDPINALAWSPDNQRVASASYDYTVKVWDVAGRKELFTLKGHTDWVRSVSWSPDGRRIASTGQDRSIRIWDATTGEPIATLLGHTADVYAVAWSPDNRLLASAGNDATVRIWDASRGELLQTYLGSNAQVRTVSWSPDGKSLASGAVDGVVKIWNAADGNVVASLKQHNGEVNAVAWSADGKSLASASGDKTVTISTGRPLRLSQTLRGHTAKLTDVSWSPDGSRLASSSDDDTVRIWDAASGKETLALKGTDGVNAVAWSPDGLSVASAGHDRLVSIYDATNGYEASFATTYLTAIDARLAADPTRASDWIKRAQIHAIAGEWEIAEADLLRNFSLEPGRTWHALGYWVVGQYPENLATSFALETSPDPAKHVLSRDSTDSAPTFLNWRYVPNGSAGFVNFGSQFDHAEHISAYALLRVYSTHPQDVALLLGSDDQSRLWLNGKVVHERLVEGRASPDEDVVRVTLQPGWNTLLARVANVTGEHALFLRVSDEPADLERAGVGTNK